MRWWWYIPPSLPSWAPEARSDTFTRPCDNDDGGDDNAGGGDDGDGGGDDGDGGGDDGDGGGDDGDGGGDDDDAGDKKGLRIERQVGHTDAQPNVTQPSNQVFEI